MVRDSILPDLVPEKLSPPVKKRCPCGGSGGDGKFWDKSNDDFMIEMVSSWGFTELTSKTNYMGRSEGAGAELRRL